MIKTYTGSCHCGAVRYQADVDLDKGSFKCNCSICTKGRNWLTMVKPDAFRLLSGEKDLSDYQFGRKVIHHLFCRHCGIHPFSWADSPEFGGKSYALNIACLEGISDQELVALPVTYSDGRHDNWREAPAETRYL